MSFHYQSDHMQRPCRCSHPERLITVLAKRFLHEYRDCVQALQHHNTEMGSLTFNNTVLPGDIVRLTSKTRDYRGHLLFNAVIEHFVLFRAHRKNPVERESVLLWSRNGL